MRSVASATAFFRMDLLEFFLCCLRRVSHIVTFFLNKTLEERKRKTQNSLDIAIGINIYVVNWIKLTINSLSGEERESWENNRKKLTVDHNQWCCMRIGWHKRKIEYKKWPSNKKVHMRIMNEWSCDDMAWLAHRWSHSYSVCNRTISHTSHQRNVNGWHKSHRTQWSYYARVHSETIQNDTIKSCKHNMRIGLKKKRTTKIDILKNNEMKRNGMKRRSRKPELDEQADAMPV